MPLVVCPSCTAKLRISEKLAGKRLLCPKCSTKIILTPVKRKAAAPVAEPAPPPPAPVAADEQPLDARWSQPDAEVPFFEVEGPPEPPAGADWFYKELGKERGPVPFATLVRFAREDEIGPETWVRQGTAGNWVVAVKVKGLFDAS